MYAITKGEILISIGKNYLKIIILGVLEGRLSRYCIEKTIIYLGLWMWGEDDDASSMFYSPQGGIRVHYNWTLVQAIWDQFDANCKFLFQVQLCSVIYSMDLHLQVTLVKLQTFENRIPIFKYYTIHNSLIRKTDLSRILCLF